MSQAPHTKLKAKKGTLREQGIRLVSLQINRERHLIIDFFDPKLYTVKETLGGTSPRTNLMHAKHYDGWVVDTSRFMLVNQKMNLENQEDKNKFADFVDNHKIDMFSPPASKNSRMIFVSKPSIDVEKAWRDITKRGKNAVSPTMGCITMEPKTSLRDYGIGISKQKGYYRLKINSDVKTGYSKFDGYILHEKYMSIESSKHAHDIECWLSIDRKNKKKKGSVKEWINDKAKHKNTLYIRLYVEAPSKGANKNIELKKTKGKCDDTRIKTADSDEAFDYCDAEDQLVTSDTGILKPTKTKKSKNANKEKKCTTCDIKRDKQS